MMALVIVGVAVLAIVAVIWSDAAQRAADDIDPEIEQRAVRFETLSAAAADLHAKLGREPSVREIYAAIEPDGHELNETETHDVVDLRTRIDRVVGDLPAPWAE
jgi:hypothetical protein